MSYETKTPFHLIFAANTTIEQQATSKEQGLNSCKQYKLEEEKEEEHVTNTETHKSWQNNF